jgi:hypothetical protein
MSADFNQVGGDHYRKMGVSPWQIIDTWPREEQIAFYRGNVLKYVLRAGSKGPALEDFQKAKHYLEKCIEVLNGKT